MNTRKNSIRNSRRGDARPSKDDLKSKVQTLQPTIRIGKNGLTEALVAETICLLKKRKLVKIKLLKSFADDVDKKQFAKDLAAKNGSKVIHQVGFFITLHKR